MRGKEKSERKKETVRLRYDKTTLPARGPFATRRLVRLAFYMYSLEEIENEEDEIADI